MQTSDKLNINPQPGKGFGQLSTEWFKYVNNVLRFLKIRNGRLIVDDDKWTIECGGGGGGVSALGVPALYMGIFMRGYKRESIEVTEWTLMTVEEEAANMPTKTPSEAIADEELYCIQPTWDYLRLPSLPPTS
jgi:hypothetical protein